MSDSDPREMTASSPRSELFTRVLAAIVLIPLALGAAMLGGWPFALFWSLASYAVLYEWLKLVCGDEGTTSFISGALALLAALLIAVAVDRFSAEILIVVLGAFAAAIFAPARRRVWAAAGVIYAGVLLLSVIVLRADPEYGLPVIVLLFGIVWATDIAGYFAGRAFGGPKLMPSVSPKKTWSGAIGGTLAAVGAAVAVAAFFQRGGFIAVAVIAVVLSAIAQAGDLFESWIKRRFGAKDASKLIPGHGGFMDRLDGFIAAAAAAAVFGLLRGGLETPAQGLMQW